MAFRNIIGLVYGLSVITDNAEALTDGSDISEKPRNYKFSDCLAE